MWGAENRTQGGWVATLETKWHTRERHDGIGILRVRNGEGDHRQYGAFGGGGDQGWVLKKKFK